MSKITCQLCGEQTHAIQVHLRHSHPEISIEEYKAQYPDAPLMSEAAARAVAAKQLQKVAMAGTAVAASEDDDDQTNVATLPGASRKAPLHEAFKLGAVKAAMNARGEPIPITVLGQHDFPDMVADEDPNYVWNIDLLKTAMMAIEINTPCMLWGFHGTGKTTIWEQISNSTNRPMIRVQHTASMVEDDILGRWTVKDGETVFEYGPLPLAMMHGWLYLADEYDFAFPQILGVYQPVLEGKPLLIKEAPEGKRLIKPHKNFRFVATGNTNGSGDETGLYQGTNIQNAANYSRFGITEQVNYMVKRQESLMVQQQASIVEEDANAIVDWASEVRKAYEAGKIGMTVGPRELINAARTGAMKSSFRRGVELAITNRYSKVDREIANEIAQRFLPS